MADKNNTEVYSSKVATITLLIIFGGFFIRGGINYEKCKNEFNY